MRNIALIICLCLGIASSSQEPVKFGKITPADLEKKIYTLDSSANAVILSDIGSTEIVGNTKGFFSLEFKRHRRVHILNKNGYDEAEVEIPLYTNRTNGEKLENVRAVTYTLENGKLVETRLEKNNIFTENVNKNLVVKKFTLPNVKEGCIIEFEYKILSDFLTNLQPWTFQGDNPHLWSEYKLALPQFFNYLFLSQGYHPFLINDKKQSNQNYTVFISEGTSATERVSFNSGVTTYRWGMKDVPALRPESFTSSINNHISKIDFQLSAYQEPLQYKAIMSSWPDVTKELLMDEDFGGTLNNANNWMNDVSKPLLSGAATDLEKAHRIYSYIRDNISCTGHYAKYATQPLKNVLKNKNGKVSDINLLLTAMLKDAGIKADPVILSTRDHGVTYLMYPILEQYNYVIVKAMIDGKEYFLDASHPRLGFGKILPDCYNGHARVINTEGNAVELEPDSLHETKLTVLVLANDEKGKWIGSLNKKPGYVESYNIRNRIKEKGKEEFFSKMQKDFGMDISMEDKRIDSLSVYDEPVEVNVDFTVNLDKEDILYINPIFAGENWKENPFKSAERFYPVEMPYVFDETYIGTIEVPVGYEVDELPKSIKVKLNDEGEGMFEYIISHSGNTISMRTRVFIKRATFHPDEYELLREFFNLVVTKQKEQIVFKKKK